jgi:hypothetical protein
VLATPLHFGLLPLLHFGLGMLLCRSLIFVCTLLVLVSGLFINHPLLLPLRRELLLALPPPQVRAALGRVRPLGGRAPS